MPPIIRQAFERQAGACRELGSPFTARLCGLFAARRIDDARVAAAVYGWPGDPSAAGDALPLRLAGALHALVLDGRSPALATVYPPRHEGVGDDALWAAVDAAIGGHAEAVLERLRRAPQTNEVQRSAALLPGFLAIARRHGPRLVLSEVGASAGLNLIWDRYGYRLGSVAWGDPQAPVQLRPRWSGPPAEPAAVEVVEPEGCDLSPLDPAEPADRLTLLSYVWADQAERLARTRTALAMAAEHRRPVARADAPAWLEARLAREARGATHVVYHSIAWQYLSPAARRRARAAIERAGARAGRAAPLAWLRLEADGESPGAALTLTIWPGGRERRIARADFHGRWIDWSGWPDGPRPAAS